MNFTPEIVFKKATLDEKEWVWSWLQEPHVQEFWDNSPEHQKDILIFMNGRKEPSNYAGGIFTYWIGFINHEPFSLMMTSEISPEEEFLPCWRDHPALFIISSILTNDKMI